MPQNENILAPITIVGNGRSGTSLLSALFRLHSECSFVGETVNTIHGIYRALQTSLPPNRHGEIAEFVRHAFLHLYPTKTIRWMQKPIGVPVVHTTFSDEDEFIGWFWQVMEEVFPNACYLTVLRHPLDVLVSSQDWWNCTARAIVESNRIVAKIITHERSKVSFAIDYRQLVEHPEREVRRLFEHVDLAFEPKCMEVFDTALVMKQNGQSDEQDSLANRRSKSFTRRDQWSLIEPVYLTDNYRAAVDACWGKFDMSFGGWAV